MCLDTLRLLALFVDTHLLRLCMIDFHLMLCLVMLLSASTVSFVAVGFGMYTFIVAFGVRFWCVGTSTLAVLIFLARVARRHASLRASDFGCGRFVQLTFAEERLLEVGSGGFVSIYEGDCPEQFLMQRADEAVRLNPWLNSVLRTDPSRGQPAMWVPDGTSGCDLLQVVDVNTREELHGGYKHRVPRGTDVLDKPGQKAFKVTLLKFAAGSCFSIIVSGNHMVADAFTLYTIWGLFSPGLPVKRLTVERNLTWKTGRLSALGSKGRLGSLWYIFIANDGPFRRMFAKTKPTPFNPDFMELVDRSISSNWLEEEKAKHVSTFDAPFVSTNDLVTSWFGRVTDCDAVAMYCDMRGKVAVLTNDLMGNYGELCVFFRREMADPSNIRRAVKSLGEFALPNGEVELPGKGRRCGLITDWRSLYVDVQFPKCTCLSHSVLTGGPEPLNNLPLCVVYQSRKDETRILLISDVPIDDGPCMNEKPGRLEQFVKLLKKK